MMYKGIVNESTSRNIEVKNGKIVLDGQEIELDLHPLSATHFHAIYQHSSYRIEVVEADYTQKIFVLVINGKRVSVQLKGELDTLLEKLGMDSAQENTIKEIRSPMPGLIRALSVSDGEAVKAGDTLVTLEAMKMENAIKSPVEGAIASVRVKVGDNVEKNQLLLTFQ